MRRFLAPSVFLVVACQPADPPVPVPQQSSSAVAEANPLVNRVWLRADGDLPGVMRVFLSDGTLVMDSCWETFRLERWESVSADGIRWHEDGAEIRARHAIADGELVLTLDLPDGVREEHYTVARVPYLCPDMPR